MSGNYDDLDAGAEVGAPQPPAQAAAGQREEKVEVVDAALVTPLKDVISALYSMRDSPNPSIKGAISYVTKTPLYRSLTQQAPRIADADASQFLAETAAGLREKKTFIRDTDAVKWQEPWRGKKYMAGFNSTDLQRLEKELEKFARQVPRVKQIGGQLLVAIMTIYDNNTIAEAEMLVTLLLKRLSSFTLTRLECGVGHNASVVLNALKGDLENPRLGASIVFGVFLESLEALTFKEFVTVADDARIEEVVGTFLTKMSNLQTIFDQPVQPLDE